MSNTKINGNGSKHRIRDNNKTRRALKPAYTATHGNATVEVTPGEKQERCITNQEYEKRKAAAIEADRPEFEGTSTDRVERLLNRPHPRDLEFENLVGELHEQMETCYIQDLREFVVNAMAWGYVLGVHHSLCPNDHWDRVENCRLYEMIRGNLGASDVGM
jgi:hypothetical protein